MCSLGIFGTKYIRDQSVPSNLIIKKSQLYTLAVEPIRSFYEIGNTLEIYLRQQSDKVLSWVSITQGSTSKVTFDAASAQVGEHSLYLESYDNNNIASVGSTLKLDIISITIEPDCVITDDAANGLTEALKDDPLKLELAALAFGFRSVSYD